MSQIKIEHGTAQVTLEGFEMSSAHALSVSYQPRDLLDATAAAMLAVNTPQSVAWASEIFKLAAQQ